MINVTFSQEDTTAKRIVESKRLLFGRIQNARVTVFSEFHSLKMDLPWFIKNILVDLPSLGIYDLVTEVINVEVGIKWDALKEKWDGTHWDELCQLLKKYPSFEEFKHHSRIHCQGYRKIESQREGYDIGEKRSLQEYYWVKKALWLRNKLNDGVLPLLAQNFSWAHEYDAVLFLVVASVDLGVKIYGVSTSNMKVPNGIDVFESVDDITNNMIECVEKLIEEKTDNKVACYSGRAHGNIPQLAPSLRISKEKMGSEYIQVGSRNKKYFVEEVVFNGSNFTIAPYFMNIGYLHVELFVGDCSDFKSARDFLKIEDPLLEARIDDIIENLRNGRVIEMEPVAKDGKGNEVVARNTVSISVATKTNKTFLLDSY